MRSRMKVANLSGRLAIAAALLTTVACDRSQPARQAPPPVVAVARPLPTALPPAPPPPPAPTVTLVLTWIIPEQPPQTTQMVFHDQGACERARDAAIAEGQRLAKEAGAASPAGAKAPAPERHYVGGTLISGAPPPMAAPPTPPPRVAAICAGS
ncbi:MAG: hypothetical protein ABI056_04620 [Caulobacteraceae bacterium]